MHLNSSSNYTPILQKETSIKKYNRFEKRLGTEPFVFSEGQMNTTQQVGLQASNAQMIFDSSESTAPVTTQFVGSQHQQQPMNS